MLKKYLKLITISILFMLIISSIGSVSAIQKTFDVKENDTVAIHNHYYIYYQ